MTEKNYRLLVGLSLLGILYLDFRPGMYALLALMVFEAVTNWRIPLLVSRLRHDNTSHSPSAGHGEVISYKFPFEAERALRVVFSTVLLVTYVLFNQNLWLFPWFAGFALAVAGLSGICPMLLFLEKLGFKPSSKVTAVNPHNQAV
jgi:Protein of unknown function (DUF2892)